MIQGENIAESNVGSHIYIRCRISTNPDFHYAQTKLPKLSYIEYRYGQNRAYKGLGQSSPHLLAFGVDLVLDQIQEKEIIRDFRALISLHIQGV